MCHLIDIVRLNYDFIYTKVSVSRLLWNELSIFKDFHNRIWKLFLNWNIKRNVLNKFIIQLLNLIRSKVGEFMKFKIDYSRMSLSWNWSKCTKIYHTRQQNIIFQPCILRQCRENKPNFKELFHFKNLLYKDTWVVIIFENLKVSKYSCLASY